MQEDTRQYDEILIVDDTPATIGVVRTALHEAGYHVAVATTGKKAIEQAALTTPDLILLDILMPGMDGYETCQRLKARETTKDIPIIFMTVVTKPFDKVKGFQLGAVDYLTKPVETEELLARVKTHLTIARLQQELQAVNAGLEQQVAARTAEWQHVNQQLQSELAERKRMEEILRQSEHRKTVLNQIANIFLTVPDEEMYAEVLSVILQALPSPLGIFGYIGETGDLIIPSLTGMIWKACQVPEKSLVFPSNTWGESLWGKAIRERKAFMSDGPFHTPEGHVPIEHFLTVPVVFGQETIGIISVANKAGGYTEADKELLEYITAYISPILKARLQRDVQERDRKWAEEALRESEELLRITMENILDPVFVTDDEGTFTFICQNVLYILDYTVEEIQAMGNIAKLVGENLFDLELLKDKGEIHNIERRIADKNGNEHDYLIVVKRVSIKGGTVLYTCHDVTERKQAEQSIALMNFALDNVHEAAFLMDDNPRLHYVNEEACRILGYTREELLDLSVTEVNPDLMAERWSSHWDELKTHQSLTFEDHHKAKDGRLIPVEINANYFEYDGQGYSLALVRDITERKQGEQERLTHLRFFENMNQINRAIQGTNDLEQMMSDVLDVVLSIFNCDRAFLMYPCDPESDTWTSSMERTKPEYPGVLELNLEIPINRDVAEFIRTLLAAAGPMQSGPDMPLLEDISEQFGFKSYMAMAIYPKIGSPWSFGIHQCSQARQWTAQEERLFQEIGHRLADGLTSLLVYRNLQESENRYRRITEGLTDYQYSVRVEDGRAVETTQSQACETVTGYTPEEFAADPHLWFNMIAPEDRELVQERIQQVLAGKEIPPLEYRLIRKDGAMHWVCDTTILLKDASGQLLSYEGVIKDITDRKRAEEEVHRLNQELEQRVLERTAQLEAANKELEAFAYSVSHDLRAPLRHIGGFLELLQQSTAGSLDERSQHYMTTIADAAKRMGLLIDDLLSFSRMGRADMTARPVELTPLVHEVIRELESEMRGRNIHWQIADLPVVMGDQAMLRIALMNLIANAVKFTRPRDRAEIEIGCQPGQGEVVIFVRDNGMGFDMQYADKLFGVFQRLHRTDEFEGTGIGLANVRRIIIRHGGRIWAEGEVNHGATFYFSLPQTPQGKGILLVNDDLKDVELPLAGHNLINGGKL